MKRKVILFLVFLLLNAVEGAGQPNNYLQIAGTVFAEKASAADVRISIIQIQGRKQDTVSTRKVTAKDKGTQGDYSFNLELNKQYRIVFQGDTLFQETRYLDVSTTLPNSKKPRNYRIEKLYVQIWIENQWKKIGDVAYDKERDRFVLIKAE